MIAPLDRNGPRPGGTDVTKREVGAVDVGAEAVELPQRRSGTKPFSGFQIDLGRLRTAERVTVFRDHQNLLMLDKERLNDHGHDRQRDEQDHGAKRRKNEPGKSAMLHA